MRYFLILLLLMVPLAEARFLPGRCSFMQEFSCVDFLLAANGTTSTLKFIMLDHHESKSDDILIYANSAYNSEKYSCLLNKTKVRAGENINVECSGIKTEWQEGDAVKFIINGTYEGQPLYGEIFTRLTGRSSFNPTIFDHVKRFFTIPQINFFLITWTIVLVASVWWIIKQWHKLKKKEKIIFPLAVVSSWLPICILHLSIIIPYFYFKGYNTLPQKGMIMALIAIILGQVQIFSVKKQHLYFTISSVVNFVLLAIFYFIYPY